MGAGLAGLGDSQADCADRKSGASGELHKTGEVDGELLAEIAGAQVEGLEVGRFDQEDLPATAGAGVDVMFNPGIRERVEAWNLQRQRSVSGVKEEGDDAPGLSCRGGHGGRV